MAVAKPQFVEWRNSSVSSILWLHGIPGSGKTSLMSMVIEHFITEISTYADAAPIAYFYCARNTAEPQRSDPAEILLSILKQLMCCKLNWQMESSTAEEYKKRKLEADRDGSDIARLDVDEAALKILDLTKNMPVTIFIDAIDECRSDLRYQLLQALEILLHESINIVKVFVSSREDADIVLKLRKSPNIYINVDDNTDDINRYVEAEIQKAIDDGRLLKGRVSPQLRCRITTSLTMKSQGMFLWTSLQIQSLCDNRRIRLEDDLVEELARLPRSLAGMYSLILDNIRQIERHGQNLANIILKWLLCTKDATRTTTIAICSAISSTEYGSLSVENILDLCCNLVMFDKQMDTFRFIHLSACEYLESQPGYTVSEVNMFTLEKLFQTLPSQESTSGGLIYQYTTRHWFSHYVVLGEQDRRRIFELHAQNFLFNGPGPSEAFCQWVAQRNIDLNDDYSDRLETLALSIRRKENRYRSHEWIPIYDIRSPVDVGVCCGFPEILEYYEKNQHRSAFRDSTSDMMTSAVTYGQSPVVHWLLIRAVRPTDNQIRKAFFLKHQKIIQIFFDLGVLCNNTLVDGQQPLILAVRYRLRDTIQNLIKNGANVNCRDRAGRTPLSYAVSVCVEGDIVEYLLRAGADPGIQDNDGETPLSLSIVLKNQILFRLFLEMGTFARPNFRDDEQLLRLALQSNCYYAAFVLLVHGVDPLFEDEEFRTHWMILLTSVVILHNNRNEIAAEARRSQKVPVLQFGQILPEDSVSQTLLSIAAHLRHEKAFQLLLNLGVDPTCPAMSYTRKKTNLIGCVHELTSGHQRLDDSGNDGKIIAELRQGPLAWAALTGNVPLVKLILEGGLDPNLRNRRGETALFLAVQYVEKKDFQRDLEMDKEAVIRLLLQKGALIACPDIQSNSVLVAHALKARYHRLVLLLLEAGVKLPEGVTNETIEPLWEIFNQGQEGIPRILLARVNTSQLDSLAMDSPSLRFYKSRDVLEIMAQLIYGGVMQSLATAFFTTDKT